jgi:hypothetical protein
MMTPRVTPPPDKSAVTKQLPGIKRYTRPETIAQWKMLMDAHDYGSALQFAQLHLLKEQADIARKAWADEVLRGQA